MQKFSVLEIIGPRMIGPSSSHTAGAARIAHVAYKLSGGDIKSAEITLYGSFADTGRGHGTDKALIAGILGMEPGDENLRIAPEIAKERGVDIRMVFSSEPVEAPNTARIKTVNAKGEVSELVGVSVGGGNILVTELNGMKLEFTGEYPTLVVRHRDVPGVINSVTSILAKEQINVAFMRVFRQVKRQDAYMVIETDTSVPERTIQLIKDWCPDITGVKTL
jgi:L-serine dehydratase